MPPRRTRTARVKQSTTPPRSVTTRSKAQKINNVKEDVIKSEKTRQSQRRKRFSDVKDELEPVIGRSTKRNVRRKSPDTKVIFNESVKKRKVSRRLNLGAEAKNKFIAQENENVDLDQSIRRLKDKYGSNISELTENSFSQSKGVDSDKKHQRKATDTGVKISPVIVTPKSTPPKLSLTPHRSKKTPKKSPISLGSPKTHSLAVPRLLKSPRKLALITASEENREKFNDTHDKKSPKSNENYLNNISISSFSKSEHEKSDINLNAIVNRLSKSSKIALRSSKCKKSNSPKLKLSFPSQVKKSSLKMSPTSALNNTLVFDKEKSLLAMKHQLLNSRLRNVLTASQKRNVLAEPIVLLKRLSIDNLSNIDKRSSRIKYNRSIKKEGRTSIPLMSSTPQEKKLSANLSNTSIISAANTSLITKSRHRNQSSVQSSIMDNTRTIENISQPSLLDKDISDINQSYLPNVAQCKTIRDKDTVTMQEKKQENKANNTYELEQPQTLNLQQMIGKRISIGANLSPRENVKRTKGVYFADLILDNSALQSIDQLIDKSINKLTIPQLSISHNVSAQRSNMNLPHKSNQVKTPKFKQNTLVFPFKMSSNLSTNRVTPRTQLSGIQVTPTSFTAVGNKSAKKSSTKKVPDFGRIHEKMFAKSESLVDAKKRLENRHLAFTVRKAPPKADVKREEKAPLPTDTRDGTHNRFGFKLRKAEATNLILKKQTAFSRQKQQHETRMALKGVRTNRRFELQMKTRNVNV